MPDITPHCMYSCIAVIDIRYLSFFTNRRKRQRRLLPVLGDLLVMLHSRSHQRQDMSDTKSISRPNWRICPVSKPLEQPASQLHQQLSLIHPLP